LARRALINSRILGRPATQIVNVTRDLGAMTEAEARAVRRAIFEAQS
jgi:hypothetical protein